MNVRVWCRTSEFLLCLPTTERRRAQRSRGTINKVYVPRSFDFRPLTNDREGQQISTCELCLAFQSDDLLSKYPDSE